MKDGPARILLVTSQPIPHTGGLSTHFQLLAGTLEQNGVLAGAVNGRGLDGGLARKLRLAASRLGGTDFARRKTLESTLDGLSEKLARLLQTRPAPGLIHCHDPLAGAAADRALRRVRLSLPVVQTVHGPWSREALMGGAAHGGAHVCYIRHLEECSFAAAAHLIAVDRGQAEILTGDFHVPAEKISVVGNGIDTAAVAALSEMPPRVEIPQPYFVVPRRLVKKNGVEVALRALAEVRSPSVLAVAGDGPLRAELQRTAAALHIRERVRFLGNLPPTAVLPLMRRAVGVLIPSVPAGGVVEATSLAALESMACGTPLVASDIGGLQEIMRQAGVGFPFRPGDAAALARVLRELEALSAGELAVLRRRTRSAAAAFDVRHWFAATQAVYSQTLDRSRRPQPPHQMMADERQVMADESPLLV